MSTYIVRNFRIGHDNECEFWYEVSDWNEDIGCAGIEISYVEKESGKHSKVSLDINLMDELICALQEIKNANKT